MNAFAPRESPELVRAMEAVARELLGEPDEVREQNTEWRYGSRGSLCVSIKAGIWHDHEAGQGGGVIDLVRAQRSLDKPGAMGWLQARGHLPRPKGEVAAYSYTDADGALLFQVVRFEPKDFRQRRPDGAGGWIWKMAGVQRVIYRLPAVVAAVQAGNVVFVVEGEKAADALAGLGVTATCSPGGANKWRRDYGKPLAGADVLILPDNDDPGRQHAAAVAKALRGAAARVRVLELPNLPPKGDVADWIAAGGTGAGLAELAEGAPETIATAAATEPADFDLTEDGVALAFTDRHSGQLRYCHHTGAWFVWTGHLWRKEDTKLAFSWARQTCRELARGASPDDRPKIAKAAFAAAVERFAQSDRAFAVTSEVWDRDPWLLGTPGGTVDLRTGRMRAAIQADCITKATAVAPADRADCPTWLRFLDDATAGDAGLIAFLQQWCGYMLTGDTREHALLFIYGPGGNGKSVLLNTVAAVMADYARNAAMETFTASQGDRHPTDLAMLRGARMVSASETEEGRAWAEVRIKQLTGGDTISARFMRQDFFEFRPQFKLIVIGNHKPVLKNVDDAARRRFNVVPFVHKPGQPDRQLEAKLQAEWPSILRWMIGGCLAWQREGLIRPQVVKDATAEYFEAQDYFSRWLAECCDLIPTMNTRPSHLLHSFQKWCEENGEPLSDNRRLRGMIERTPGLKYVATNGVRWVRGIVIRPDSMSGQGAGVQGGAG